MEFEASNISKIEFENTKQMNYGKTDQEIIAIWNKKKRMERILKLKIQRIFQKHRKLL